jgi:hypothetical protein
MVSFELKKVKLMLTTRVGGGGLRVMVKGQKVGKNSTGLCYHMVNVVIDNALMYH